MLETRDPPLELGDHLSLVQTFTLELSDQFDQRRRQHAEKRSACASDERAHRRASLRANRLGNVQGRYRRGLGSSGQLLEQTIRIGGRATHHAPRLNNTVGIVRKRISMSSQIDQDSM